MSGRKENYIKYKYRKYKKKKEMEKRKKEQIILSPTNMVNRVHINQNLEWSINTTGILRIVRQLGEGAFGVVYLVEHESGLNFAVKEFKSDNNSLSKSFLAQKKKCSLI